MKKSILLHISLQSNLIFSALAEPRPDFIPPTPAVSKPIAQYSVADVMGIIATETRQLPADHPYVINKEYSKSIKINWPGSKVSTSIDAMIQIVLNAPPITDPTLPIASQIEGAWGNVEYFIYKIMDIPDVEKAGALLRTINAQTDAHKKSRAIVFSRLQFSNLLDPRLLALVLPDLDNTKTYTELYKISEESPRRLVVVRREAKELILSELEDVMEIDRAPFEVADEAIACAALKAWWTDNFPLITAKCAEKKSDPKWVRRSFFGKPWDVKW